MLVDNKAKEYKREKEEIEEVNDSLKSELRQMRHDNTLLDNKNQELETKLKKANEDLMREATAQQQELDTWKDTCDRLTASVSRKENEIQTLSDRLLDMEDLTSRLEGDNKVLKDECEKLSEDHEDKVKLKDENRKLIQERAENEQMIKLLETQKEVLTKSSESSLTKLHDVEQLSGKVEQFRNENEHLRERILELEKVRDDLVNQKEELLASTELIYKKPRLEELENKVEELRHANRQLREINDSVNDKLDNFQQENLEMKEALVSSAPKIEVDRKELEEAEKQPVSGPEVDHLQSEIEALREELERTQREKNKKDTLIRSLKDESLDDVGSELTEVKGELHKLIGVIQDKDRNIETLESELKLSKENLNRKEREMRGMGSDSDDRSLGRSEDGKTEKDVHRSKSLTDKGSNSGGDRLQSLISKYRSYGETGNTFPERKIKPLSLSGSSSKMGLVTKGRSFGPAAPKDQVSDNEEIDTVDGVQHEVISPESEGPLAQSSPAPSYHSWDERSYQAEGGVAVSLDYDELEDLDTQEQKDISALIQKQRATRPKPLFSVRPPKITSKIIADLLKANLRSDSKAKTETTV
ncbi:Hypothetical predicted protein [Mytilus galloprovincialis]|uniref:Uncharacterized protein n=1 Tax=Mytilus galloprovincialis TaxID=29158 RepID=A0A8B6GQ25_MYTGA|nr:Hypothetical predicted protein [Mytilus galloprovincialis]